MGAEGRTFQWMLSWSRGIRTILRSINTGKSRLQPCGNIYELRRGGFGENQFRSGNGVFRGPRGDVMNGYDSVLLDTTVGRGEERALEINAAW